MVRLLVIALAMTGLVGAPEPIRVSDAARACVVHLPPVARYVDFKATSTYDVRTDRWGKVVRVTGRETRTAGLMDSKAVENDLRGWNVTPAGRYEVRVTTGMGLAQATFYEVCRPNRRDCVRVEPRQPCPVFDRK